MTRDGPMRCERWNKVESNGNEFLLSIS